MAVAKNTNQYRHDAILMAGIGEFCFVADLDASGNEVPDRWILPGRPLLMKQTCRVTGATVGTYGKGRVVDTAFLKRFADSIGKPLLIGEYEVSRR